MTDSVQAFEQTVATWPVRTAKVSMLKGSGIIVSGQEVPPQSIRFVINDADRASFLEELVDLYNAVKGDKEGIGNA